MISIRGTSRREGHRTGAIGAASVLAVLVATLAVTPAMAAAAPSARTAAANPGSVAVAPATRLIDGQYVTLTINLSGNVQPLGLALCETGASPLNDGECGSATADGSFSYQSPGGSVVVGAAARAQASPVSGARRPFSVADGSSAAKAGTASATPPPTTLHAVIQLDAAFRDPSGTLIDCRTQPGSRCDLVVPTWDLTTGAEAATVRTAVTFKPDAPLRPPLTMTASPVTALHDGQQINLAFHNVKAGTVSAVECAATAATPADAGQLCGYDGCTITAGPSMVAPCLPSPSVGMEVQADAAGNAWAQLAVHALLETTAGLVDCRTAASPCVLETGDQLTGPITQPLAFDSGAPLNLPGPEVYFRPGSAPSPTNGWTTTIDLAGFAPNGVVKLTWCSSTACDPSTLASGFTTETGTTNSAGIALPSPLPAPAPSLRCAPTNPCHVRVDDQQGTATSLPGAVNTGQPPTGMIQSENRPVSVTPDANLADGQQVHVSGQGFPPNSPVYLVECTQDASTHGISACDLSTEGIGRTDAHGILAPTAYTVHQTVNLGGDQIDCAEGNVDPTEFQLHNMAGDPAGVLGTPGYRTCIIAVAALSDNYAHSGFQAVAFTGETFKPFAGDTTPHQLSATPLAPPCERVSGTPRDVRLAYQRLADRCPSPQELAWWDTSVRGGNSLTSAMVGIALSPAALAQTVSEVYHQVLQRAPDAGGATYWAAVLANAHRRDLFEASLLTSRELHADLPQDTPQAWIAALYHDVLGRSGSAAEIGYWVGRLDAGITPAHVALAIVDSRESGARELNIVYQRVLHRRADAGGTAYWLGALNPNSQTFTLIGALASSSEFTSAADTQPSPSP